MCDVMMMRGLTTHSRLDPRATCRLRSRLAHGLMIGRIPCWPGLEEVRESGIGTSGILSLRLPGEYE